MKKRFFLLALLSVLLLPACEETDLSPVEGRLDNLEGEVKDIKAKLAALDQINKDIAALQTLKTCTYVSGTLYNAQTGVWTISLSDGTVIDVAKAGGDSNVPSISIDAEGYWTVNGERIIVGGKPVSAVPGAGDKGETPVLGVDAEGYWTVTVGGTTSRITDTNNQPVKAVIEAGDSYFKDVKLEGGKITFTLKNDESITLSVAEDAVSFKFEIQGVDGIESFEEEETKVYTVAHENVADVMISAPEGWLVSLDDTKLSVTAPIVTKALNVSTADSDIVFYVVCVDGRSVIVRMSVVVGPAPYNKKSLYSMYEYGLPIEIDGVQYTKAEYGESKLLSAGDAATDGAHSIFFVPEGATAELAGCGETEIVLSDKAGVRAKAVIAGVGSPVTVILKDLSISWKDGYTNNMFWSGKDMETMAFFNCELVMSNYLVNRSSYGIKNVVVKDCDIKVLAANLTAYSLHRALIICGAGLSFSGSKFVFTNNIMTSDNDDTAVEWGIFSTSTANQVSYDELTVTNNTFYNIKGNGSYGNYAFAIGSAKNVTLTKNLLWKHEASDAFNWIRLTGVTAAGAAALKDANNWTVADNKLEGWPVYASDAAVISAGNGEGQGGYYPRATAAFPFVSATPVASGDFSVIAALDGYGAKR